MKIAVLNGSPKGDTGVTIQSVHYLQKQFPEHDFRILHIGKRIKGIESKRATFDDIIAEIATADGVLWAFPVYYLLVPSQMKRFIELIHLHGAASAFAGKYAAAFTTSIHFYDHTAHRYIQAISDDLDMRFVTSFSADMMDLLKPDERQRLVQFGDQFLSAIQNQRPTSKSFQPLIWPDFTYQPDEGSQAIDAGNKKVLVITDAQPEDTNLAHMVERFCTSFTAPVEVVNLHELNIVSGCIGCLQCGYDNTCSFGDRDDFVAFYREKVLPADVLIFAGTMRDRYLSARWKSYFDRSFFLGHTPTLMNKQIGFIVAGPLGENANLREVFEAYVGMQHANLLGFVTDSVRDSAALDALLQELARQGIALAENGYIQPITFLGVGGRLLFRDEIWGRLRTVFQADYQVYKKLGWYDFPTWNIPTRLLSLVGSLGMRIPRIRKKIQQVLKEGSSMQHRRIVEKS